MTSTDKTTDPQPEENPTYTVELEGVQALAFERTLNQFCDWLAEYQDASGKSAAEVTMGLTLLSAQLDVSVRTCVTLGLGVINAKLLRDGVINETDILEALGIAKEDKDAVLRSALERTDD